MKCTKCGADSPNGSKFCKYCGATFAPDTTSVETAEASNGATSAAPTNAAGGEPDFLKKIIDKIPSAVFPKLSKQSVHVIGITVLVLSSLAMLFSFVPCLGAYSFFVALPALYVSIMAIRRADKTSTILMIGLIFSIVAFFMSWKWISAISAISGE